jgi:hypothetical protein
VDIADTGITAAIVVDIAVEDIAVDVGIGN